MHSEVHWCTGAFLHFARKSASVRLRTLCAGASRALAVGWSQRRLKTRPPRLNRMRLCLLLLTAILAAPAAWAQSSAEDQAKDSVPSLPVSLDKIRDGLETSPVLSLRTLNERPTFTVMIRERQKIEELLASINFKSSSPSPAGGLYAYEQQRVMFPSVDHPLVQ